MAISNISNSIKKTNNSKAYKEHKTVN